MHRTLIKICGITRLEDGIAAAEAGADFIGLNFYPKSKRYIQLNTAKRILDALPQTVTPVGLFVDATRDEIHRIADALHLSHIQLHGNETPALVEQLSNFAIFKSIPADRGTLSAQVNLWKNAHLPQLKTLLLETPNTGHAGGSGIENDWSTIAAFHKSGLFQGAPSLIAAGGLNADNVAAVIGAIHPYAVDVSSGVETSPGQKSAGKIHDFIQAVRLADQIQGAG